MQRKGRWPQLSDEAEAIYSHMTLEEQQKVYMRGAKLNLALLVLFVPPLLLLNLLVFTQIISSWFLVANLLMALLARRFQQSYESWIWRVTKDSFCQTGWAKDQGYTPNNLMLFADGSDVNP